MSWSYLAAVIRTMRSYHVIRTSLSTFDCDEKAVKTMPGDVSQRPQIKKNIFYISHLKTAQIFNNVVNIEADESKSQDLQRQRLSTPCQSKTKEVKMFYLK